MIPPWVVADLSVELTPPAHVRKLGDVRSAENTLLITRALLGISDAQGDVWIRRAVPDVVIPQRYRPEAVGTKCNIFSSDVMQLLKAPLPHWWWTNRAAPAQWMSANDMTQALRRDLYPGWSRIEPSRLDTPSIPERAALGMPTVATWFNPGKRKDGTSLPGHIVVVVPTPAGRSGIYVTGAGRTCVDQCPLAQAFGSHVSEVEFWGHP